MANNILKIKTTQGVPKYVHDIDPARYHDRFHTIKKIEKRVQKKKKKKKPYNPYGKGSGMNPSKASRTTGP